MNVYPGPSYLPSQGGIALSILVMVSAQAFKINDQCGSSSDCPANASCRAKSCLGYICFCDPGFQNFNNKCIVAVHLGGSCVHSLTCPPFGTCVEGACRCGDGLREHGRSRCLPEGDLVGGERCGVADGANGCSWDLICRNGVCVCPPNMREKTDEETHLLEENFTNCVPTNYSLHVCNGSLLTVPPDLRDTATTNRPSSARDTQTPVMALTLVLGCLPLL